MEAAHVNADAARATCTELLAGANARTNAEIGAGMWTGCPDEKCRREWRELTSGTQEDEDRLYASGNYGLQHCEYPGCHTIYFRGKNGGACEICGLEVCEFCQCDETRMVSLEDEFSACVGECERKLRRQL